MNCGSLDRSQGENRRLNTTQEGVSRGRKMRCKENPSNMLNAVIQDCTRYGVENVKKTNGKAKKNDGRMGI